MEIWIIWLLAAATLIGVEVLTQMVWTLCLAIGCLASALSALLGADVALQISIAGIVSVIAYLALKPWFEKWQKKAADRNRHAARTGIAGAWTSEAERVLCPRPPPITAFIIA